MKRKFLFLAAATVLLATHAGGAIAEEGAAEATVLAGEFVWNQRGDPGDLEAVFTEVGEGRWKVAFHFEFRGRDHVYEGTATGSLSEGALEGEVRNENKKRTFTFSGAFEEGTFRGTHAETTGGGAQNTGTMRLSASHASNES